jgi:hypothetical protein
MLSYLDTIIFPDECVILESSARQLVYPIFKNGSSFLRSNCTVIAPEKIRPLTEVVVFVRDPYDRFVSGVQTFVSHNSDLHEVTVLKLIEQYLFLNRHFCLQFHWIANLCRHLNVAMTLKPLSSLSEVIGVHNIENKQQVSPAIYDHFLKHSKLHFYLQMDKVLTEDLLDQTVYMTDILRKIQHRFPEVYDEIIQRSKNICGVLG